MYGSDDELGDQPPPPGTSPRPRPAGRQPGPGGPPPDDAQAAANVRPPANVPAPAENQDQARALQERAAAEAKARTRETLKRQLVADNMELLQEEFEAEANAELEVDERLRKRANYLLLLSKLRQGVAGFKREGKAVMDSTTELSECLGEIAASELPTPELIRKARCLEKKACMGQERLVAREAKLTEEAAEVAAAYYRKISHDESSQCIIEDVGIASMEIRAIYQTAADELNEILSPADKSVPVSVPANTDASTAAAVKAVADAAKPKICARDFQIGNWVRPTFSGEETDALSVYQKWRDQWDFAVTKVMKMCEDPDGDSLLHLLQATLKGEAAHRASTALDVETALSLLESKYDDIVGLIASQCPSSAPPGESKSGTKETADALIFAQRWPRLRKQLEPHGIEFDDFNGIERQLAAFGGDAREEWRTHVKAEKRRLPEDSKLGEVYNWEVFVKWLRQIDEEAEKKARKPQEDGSTSAGVFSASASDLQASSDISPGCLICGPGVSHKSATCRKLPNIPNEEFFEKVTAKGWCKRCVQHKWSPAHARQCSVTCSECNRAHITSRHRYAQAASKDREKAKKREASSSSSSSGRYRRDEARPHKEQYDVQERKKQRVEPSREPQVSALEKRLRKLERAQAKPQSAWKEKGPKKAPKKAGAKKERNLEKEDAE